MQDEQPRIIPAGGYWLGVVPSGRILRLTDAHGNQAADTLFFNADDFTRGMIGELRIGVSGGAVAKLTAPILSPATDPTVG